MESKRLKQRLARLFRPSVLLRSPCNHSTSTTSSSSIFSSSTPAGSTSSRRSISTSVAVVEPVFLPRNVVDIPLFLRGKVDRPLSIPGRPDVCGNCRFASRTSSERNLDNNKESRVGQNEDFSDTPTSPKNGYFYFNNRFKENNKKKKKKKNVIKSKKLLSNGYGFSSSSSDSDEEGFELFSSSGEQCNVVNGEETETFFSSFRSFSSDSTEFYTNSRKKKKNINKENNEQNKKPISRRPPMHTRIRSNESGMIRVTKRSRDPYVDFRNSMVEMIVERQILGTKGLEELLRSYLSLNSSHHHPVILRAFADISQVLFGQ